MAVGRSADNALMTTSNTPHQIDTEVVAARCRELFDAALRSIYLVLRVGNHGFEALLAIGVWLPVRAQRKERTRRRQFRFWNKYGSQQNIEIRRGVGGL